MAGKEVLFRMITGEGTVVDFEKMSVEAAKEKCRENLKGNCMRDFKPCDLAETGTCRQGSPCLIAQNIRRVT